MTTHALVRFGSFAGCLLLLAGCAGQTKQNSTIDESVAVSCIAVMPAMPTVDYDAPDAQAKSTALLKGSQVVNELVRELLNSPKVRFVGEQDLSLGSPTLDKSREIANGYQCNVVLDISVSRFEERVGGEYGVKQPAAVTFAYRLFETDEGRVFCHGRFDEQQQSLMENLFTLSKAQSRGLTWLSAKELARDGLQEKFGECQYLQEMLHSDQ